MPATWRIDPNRGRGDSKPHGGDLSVDRSAIAIAQCGIRLRRYLFTALDGHLLRSACCG